MYKKVINTKINDEPKKHFEDLGGFSKGKQDRTWLDHRTQAIQQCLANNLGIEESEFKVESFRENGYFIRCH
jgi:hypothetical protein